MVKIRSSQFKKKIDSINKQIGLTISRLYNSYKIRRYTKKQLKRFDKFQLNKIIKQRYGFLKSFREKIFELRFEKKMLLLRVRDLLIENYNLRLMKNKKNIKKKLNKVNLSRKL